MPSRKAFKSITMALLSAHLVSEDSLVLEADAMFLLDRAQSFGVVRNSPSVSRFGAAVKVISRLFLS